MTAATGTDEPLQPAPAHRPWVLVSAAAVLVLAAAMGARWALPASEPVPGFRIAVLPFAHFSSEPEVALLAARITDGVTSSLARARGPTVVSHTSAVLAAGRGRSARDIAAALHADLLVEGSVVVEDSGLHVTARLVDPVSDRKVWVGEFDSRPDRVAELTRRIAEETALAAVNRLTQPAALDESAVTPRGDG
jgi:TolB-like protein